ncbi:hypothetical protein ABZ858_13705 [Streptomyces sp. NPDC047017]|uniref:hypothetical protein n=1 Tax=Streptomyces sp. NPDC047017 TaxID=3155024 RepID=UPI0033EBCC0F
MLDDLGAAPLITAGGVIDLPTRFHEPSGAVVDMPIPPVRAGENFATPYPDPTWIGRFDVEAALRHRLEVLGGAVEYGSAPSTRNRARTG